MLTIRHSIIGLLISGLIATGLPEVASAEMGMSMTLAPHCTEQDRAQCPSFEVIDGTNIRTGKLSAGDILDLDLVVTGNDFSAVRLVRAWLNYEPSILEYRSVELTSELPSPTPGEQTSDPVGKVVKIGGSTTTGLSGDNRSVARITFRVVSTTSDTVISFNDFKADGSGHTAVNGERNNPSSSQGSLPEPPCFDQIIGCRGTASPLLFVEPSKLTVTLQDPTAMSSSSATSIDTTASSSGDTGMMSSAAMRDTGAEGTTLPSETDSNIFSILQVQGVKVTTRDSLVFVGWNELRTTGLKGYNVYYSTVSGRYIQRHSVPATERSLTLRNLAPDTTYYFAVRGVNTQDQETVFSQEVSVTVGQPDSASAPLLAMQTIGLDDSGPEGNPMEIHNGQTIQGETGTGSVVFMLIAASAVIGTGFAFRRQMNIVPLHPHAA